MFCLNWGPGKRQEESACEIHIRNICETEEPKPPYSEWHLQGFPRNAVSDPMPNLLNQNLHFVRTSGDLYTYCMLRGSGLHNREAERGDSQRRGGFEIQRLCRSCLHSSSLRRAPPVHSPPYGLRKAAGS